jgi:hypothetical protein
MALFSLAIPEELLPALAAAFSAIYFRSGSLM